MKSLLDTVEPDAYEIDCGFMINSTKQFITGKCEDREFYEKETVEALLDECRKQTLLNAADWFDLQSFYERNEKGEIIGYAENELRRMAEGEKNEHAQNTTYRN